VFPVRYELNSYISYSSNPFFKGLIHIIGRQKIFENISIFSRMFVYSEHDVPQKMFQTDFSNNPDNSNDGRISDNVT
jgi:hypothetical protein